MSGVRSPGQRAGLDRARVIAAARRMLSATGDEGLTMRALAGSLGVSPNSLYSHVASRSELVDSVLDDVLGEVGEPDPGGASWRAELRAVMTSTYAVLLANQRLVPLFAARYSSGPNAQRLGARMLALLARGGLDEARASVALRVLIVYTVGFAAFATREMPLAKTEPPDGGTGEAQASFESGLEWLLAGICGGA